MKNLKSTLLTLAALLCSTVASAYSFKVDGIFYDITNSSALTVGVTYESGDHNSYKGDVVIPATVTNNNKEYRVTSIGLSAFYGCSSLASITIPESVTSIGNYAFQGCSSLTSFILPESVTLIGSQAFYNCSSLASITIPESVTSIGNLAFQGCSSLTHIYIGSIESWLKINYSSESSHPNYSGKDVKLYLDGELLTEVEIPATITSIPSYAFYKCRSLTSITLPEGVTSIGGYAFCDCSRLTSITLPESVTSIGFVAFASCRSLIDVVLKSITPPALTTPSFPLKTVFTVPGAAYEAYLTASYWKDLASQITIDDADARVKSVALTAEADKSALHVAIGDEDLKFVTDLTVSGSINSYDFMVMRNKMPLLRHLNLEDATIVANAYEHYSGYCTQDNKFPGYGLYNCKLISLTFPKNITSVGYYGVANNAILSDVTLFEGVSSIGGNAFSDCDALTTITLPEGVTSIGGYAFYSCVALTNITFLDGLTSIGSSAFRGCSVLESVVLPPTVKTIGSSAFSSCHSLKEIRIPSSIRSVGDNAFYCSNLNDVYVYTVEPINIGQNTFAKSGNNFTGTLHAPKVSYWEYYYDTQWSQFASFAEFESPTKTSISWATRCWMTIPEPSKVKATRTPMPRWEATRASS